MLDWHLRNAFKSEYVQMGFVRICYLLSQRGPNTTSFPLLLVLRMRPSYAHFVYNGRE